MLLVLDCINGFFCAVKPVARLVYFNLATTVFIDALCMICNPVMSRPHHCHKNISTWSQTTVKFGNHISQPLLGGNAVKGIMADDQIEKAVIERQPVGIWRNYFYLLCQFLFQVSVLEIRLD